MWQAKELREGVFGSVAMIGLSRRFLGSVANKGVMVRLRSFDSVRSLPSAALKAGRTRILPGCPVKVILSLWRRRGLYPPRAFCIVIKRKELQNLIVGTN